MKENSIEEDIKIVENYLANSAINEIDSNFFKNSGWETVDLEIPKSMQHILPDYKRVLKENEELLEVKVSASAHNRILELEKENEELKNFKKQVTEIESTNFIKYKNFISKQKVKDNLIKYQEEYELLLEHQSGKESNRTKYLRGRIHMCQELLESEE